MLYRATNRKIIVSIIISIIIVLKNKGVISPPRTKFPQKIKIASANFKMLHIHAKFR